MYDSMSSVYIIQDILKFNTLVEKCHHPQLLGSKNIIALFNILLSIALLGRNNENGTSIAKVQHNIVDK